MEVLVERCWGGNSNYYFRLTPQNSNCSSFRVKCEEDGDFESVKEEAERILSIETGSSDFNFIEV